MNRFFIRRRTEKTPTASQKSITFVENHKAGRSRRFVSRETLVLSALSAKKREGTSREGSSRTCCGSEKCK